LSGGVAALSDAPRSGAPHSINDEAVSEVVRLTLESLPSDAPHWSTRSMARRSGMSQTAISRIWRAFGLKPHLVETFKISGDPFFVEKVRDVVGLYMNPPHNAVVFCVDEKSQIQALDRSPLCYRCVLVKRNAGHMITSVMGPRHFSRLEIL